MALLAALLVVWAALGSEVVTSETTGPHPPTPLLPILGEGGIRLPSPTWAEVPAFRGAAEKDRLSLRVAFSPPLPRSLAPLHKQAGGGGLLAPSTGPELIIPNQVPAEAGGTVTVPVTLTANGNAITSLIFSVDYDAAWLSLDPTDSDEDGIPDAVTFDVPAAFATSATFDGNDTDGEIDVMIADLSPPLAGLPDGDVLSITLEVASPSGATEAAVNFSHDPPASFGNTEGQSVAGTTDGGSVLISSGSCPAFVTPPVDAGDLQDLAAHWHTDVGGGSTYDLDDDGDADVVDVMRLAGLWGSPCD